MESRAGTVRQDLLASVHRRLASVADPARAAGQQAYMKSSMPYRGVTAPVLAATLRPVLADPSLRLMDREGFEATVRALWDGADYREDRYAALAITGHRLYRQWQDPGAVLLYRHLLTTGAWWDYTDLIASRRIGPILRDHPEPMAALLRTWACDPDRWVRRTAIISQLGSRDATDRVLLRDCIEPNLEDPDFFVRKAIGWALREQAKSTGGQDWVRAAVAHYGDRLSPLSRREALKHL